MAKAGKIVMVVGPMYSGKTSELLNFVEIYRIGGKSYKIFKMNKDTRYSETDIVSHRGHGEKALVVSDSQKLFQNVSLKDHAVFIDEIQFFDENIINVIKELQRRGVDVYCSGLDVSFKNNPFAITAQLLCLADEIIKKRAVCYMCKEYSATISHKTINNDSEVDIGGAEKYISVCKNCYLSLIHERHALPNPKSIEGEIK